MLFPANCPTLLSGIGTTLVACAALLGPSHAVWAEDIVITAVVSPEVEVDVPAPVTGLLDEVLVQENVMVMEDTVLARIDDRTGQVAHRLAQAKLEATRLEAEDRSAIEEAEATLELAVSELRKYEELLKGDATSEAEVERARLAEKQARLRLANRLKQMELAVKRLEITEIELQDAELQVERHLIRAKAAANVFAIYHRAGEWVREGDPIMKLVQMDRLRVEGQIDADRFNREDVHSRRVTVEFERARGEKVTFTGRIIYTGLREAKGSRIQVRAEVQNKVVADHWVLHPGAEVTLTIHDDELAEIPSEDGGTLR